MSQGDATGVGPLASFPNVFPDDDGNFLVHATLSAAPSADEVVLQGLGSAWGISVIEGDEISPGLFVAGMRDLGLTPPCVLGPYPFQTFSLASSAGFGFFWATVPLFKKGDVSTAPEFPAGTVLEDLTGRVTAGDAALAVGLVNKGAGLKYALMRIVVDTDLDGNGSCDDAVDGHTQEALVQQGDFVPSTSGDKVKEISNWFNTLDLNERGDYAFLARFDGFNWKLVLNKQIVLAENGMSIPGGTGNFIVDEMQSRVNVNEFGDHVIATKKTGGGEVIVKNGVKLFETGDPVPDPSVGSFQLVNFGYHYSCSLPPPMLCPPTPMDYAPVFITNSGDVVWFGQWNDDPGSNEGIFINDRLIAKQGDFTRDGEQILSFGSGNNQFRTQMDVSANGRYVMFVAVLDELGPSVLKVDLGESVPFGTDIQGCSYPYSNLTLNHVSGLVGGTPTIGTTFACTMGGIPPSAHSATLTFSSSPWPAFPCGPMVGGSELLIKLSTPHYVDTMIPPVTFRSIPMPNDPNFIGVSSYAQVEYRDVSGALLGRTNGIRFVFGERD